MSRIVDVNGSPFRKHVIGPNAGFTVTVAGRLGTAERQVTFRANRRGVDIDDPGVDIADFAIEVHSDLPEDGKLAGRVMELMLKHYETDDPAIAEKVELGLLEYEIRHAHQRVRASIRQAEREQAG